MMGETVASVRGNQVIIHMGEMTCHTPQDIMRSPLLERITQRFLHHLAKHDSPLIAAVRGLAIEQGEDGLSDAANAIADVLRLLVDNRPAMICQMVPALAPLLDTEGLLADFIDKLYDFWRNFERYLIFQDSADASRDRAIEGHLPFVRANDELKQLTLLAYRRIDSNLRGYWPRVYHQVPAGASIGLLVDAIHWPCPDGPYAMLRDVPFVRLALLELPVLLSPGRSSGNMPGRLVHCNPLEGVAIDPQAWYCLPLQVGRLLIHVFFHENHLGLASSLVNLFEIAGHADARRAPDGLLIYSLPAVASAPGETVVYEDTRNNIALGVITDGESAASFDALTGMIFTLHNMLMIRRGLLPVRGAMLRVELQDGTRTNILIAGDRSKGKTAMIEAFRNLVHDELRAMAIIFDEIGVLELQHDGSMLAYGAATGAFVTLDELHPGYAFGQIDRGILLNPQQEQAQMVIPLTSYEEITAGHHVDMLFHVEHAQQPDGDAQHALHLYQSAEQALDAYLAVNAATHIRRAGADSAAGCAHADDAEALQLRLMSLARSYCTAMLRAGIDVGELHIRAGVPGYDTLGAQAAARALYEHVRRKKHGR